MYHLLICNLNYRKREIRNLYKKIDANILIAPSELRELFASNQDDNDIINELTLKILTKKNKIFGEENKSNEIKDNSKNEREETQKQINFIIESFTYKIMSDIIIESLKKVKNEIKEPTTINIYVENTNNIELKSQI